MNSTIFEIHKKAMPHPHFDSLNFPLKSFRHLVAIVKHSVCLIGYTIAWCVEYQNDYCRLSGRWERME